MSNTFGSKFKVTTYGESHGPAVGAVIDGCPSGLKIDTAAIEADLARRRQGAPRQETDTIEWLSGVYEGVTLGTPLAFLVRNDNTRSADYDNLEHLFRPGHADYTYYAKYGIRDHRGGGRASARETIARVVAGAIAKQLLSPITIHAEAIVPADRQNDETYGGIVRCRIEGLEAGIGEPVYGKLNAALAGAMMSIPSAIGFEMGAGFATTQMTGCEYIDRWNGNRETGAPLTLTNHCGGIQGGISNGMPIEFSVAFHPVATLPEPVECLHEDGHLETITVNGRHDRCAVLRAPVIVEAMAALTIINYKL